MKKQLRSASFSLLAVLCLALAAMPAMADNTLYSNGAYNGTVDALQISSGYVVSDTFTLNSDSQVNSLSFVFWLYPGDTMSSLDISITSEEYAGATYNTTKSNIKAGRTLGYNEYGYQLVEGTADGLSVNLSAGTYWLNLQNGTTVQGDPVFWDENNGPSQASENSAGTLPSEVFTVSNSGGGTTPEPSSLALFGSGVLGLGGLLRKRFV